MASSKELMQDLRNEIEEKGINRADLARRCDMAKQTMYRTLSHANAPGLDRYAEIRAEVAAFAFKGGAMADGFSITGKDWTAFVRPKTGTVHVHRANDVIDFAFDPTLPVSSFVREVERKLKEHFNNK